MRRWPTALSVVRKISPILSDAVSILRVKTMLPEKYVDAAVAAEFLSISPRHLLDLARRNALSGHRLGTGSLDKDTAILQRGQLQPSSGKGFAWLTLLL